MTEVNKFIHLLSHGDEDQVIDAAQNVGHLGFKTAIPILLNILESTENHNIRNAIALALGDLQEQQAVQILIKKILDSKNRDYNGTLIYALKSLNIESVFTDLVNFMRESNYESSLMILQILDSGNQSINDANIQQGLLLLNEFLEEGNIIEWRREAIVEAINILQGSGQS